MKKIIILSLVVLLLLNLYGCGKAGSSSKQGLYVMTQEFDRYGNKMSDIEYDDTGRISKAVYFSDGSPYYFVEYEYNQNGKLIQSRGYEQDPSENSAAKPHWCHDHTYDSNGNRVSLICYEYQRESIRYEYSYDANGNMLTKYVLDSKFGAHKSYYTYDADGKLKQAMDTQKGSAAWITDYQYDTGGNLVAKIEYSKSDNNNQLRAEYKYDEYGNIISETTHTKQRGTKAISYTYTYDKSGCTVTSSSGGVQKYKKIKLNKAQAQGAIKENAGVFIEDVKNFYIED